MVCGNRDAYQESSWFKTCWQMLCPWPHILINTFAPLKLNHCTALILIRYSMLPNSLVLCFNQPLCQKCQWRHLLGSWRYLKHLLWCGLTLLSYRFARQPWKGPSIRALFYAKSPWVASLAQFSSSRKIPFYPLLPFNLNVCICSAKLIVNTFFCSWCLVVILIGALIVGL